MPFRLYSRFSICLSLKLVAVAKSAARRYSIGPVCARNISNMRGPRKFCQRGSNSDNEFFDERRDDPY